MNSQTNRTFGLGLVFSLFAVACGGSKSKWEDVGPRVAEGYYSSSSEEAKNLPLVSVVKVDGNTYSYVFLKYDCGQRRDANFSRAGVTFDDNPANIAAPSVFVGNSCAIETDIVAHSPTSIQVTVTINGQKRPPYILGKTTKESFLTSLKVEATQPEFSATDEACEASFGQTCASLDLAYSSQ